MNGAEAALHWLALGFACAAFVVGVAALMARSLFAMCMYLAATGVLAAAAVLGLRAGDAALAVVLFAAALAPVLRTTPPEKEIVAPVLFVSEMPPPSPSLPSLIAPVKLLVPPLQLFTRTSWPMSSVIVPL